MIKIRNWKPDRKTAMSTIARAGLFALTLMGLNLANAADWAPAGDMNVVRWDHNAVLLNDGRVLIDSQVYNPTTGLWGGTSTMYSSVDSSATLLTDGRVLVAGDNDIWFSGVSPFTQIYDPSTNTWSATTPMNFARANHLAVRLMDGRVLVAGGDYGVKSAEIFDPSTSTWTLTGSMIEGHTDGSITLLDDGKVLVVGGMDDSFAGVITGLVEIYDPAMGSWSTTTSLPSPWVESRAVKLNDGRVLATYQSTSIIYDPSTASWSPTGPVIEARRGHSLTLLADGNVLAAGAIDMAAFGYNAYSAEIYDVTANTWTRTEDMPETRSSHTATLLKNGHVLLAGGEQTVPVCCGTKTTILYTPPGTPAPPILPPPPPPPAPLQMHIGDIDNSTDAVSAGAIQWLPRVTFSVIDQNNQPVQAALVSGAWSNGLLGNTSCSTNSLGTCEIVNLTFPKISTVPNPVFTVTDVSKTDATYDATLNTDPDGDSDGTAIVVYAPVPPPSPPPAPAASTYISDLDGSSQSVSRRRWQATVTVHVTNDLGGSVSNATVGGNWSDGYAGTGSCTTNNTGSCSLSTGRISTKKNHTRFTVTSVTNGSLIYDSASNSDPDGDSDGTTITVQKP